MKPWDLSYYRGKRVFLTGHTGFKGSWLCRILLDAGAEVYGYALAPEEDHALFYLAGLGRVHSVFGDVRNAETLRGAFDAASPEVVLHMAAQPLVRESYARPAYTYETNVMGTVNLLECLRGADQPVRSFLNVTTDKVYLNTERETGYREDEPLDGYDPYSNSKSCSELVTHSYAQSFLTARGTAVSTARAGNVIGGGDLAENRIIPDCIRAASEGRLIGVRNPYSVRPYQHVLEPLFAYLMIAAGQAEDPSLAGWYNVGPDESDCLTTGALADLFCTAWGEGASWENLSESNAPHEAGLLKLDCTKLKETFAWAPRWDAARAVEETVRWSKIYFSGGDVPAEMDREIESYIGHE